MLINYCNKLSGKDERTHNVDETHKKVDFEASLNSKEWKSEKVTVIKSKKENEDDDVFLG